MEATFTETSQLLRLAGHGSLYPKVRRDAAIIFAIEKKYTMQQANELLAQSSGNCRSTGNQRLNPEELPMKDLILPDPLAEHYELVSCLKYSEQASTCLIC